MGRCLGLDEVTRVGLGDYVIMVELRGHLKRSDSREFPHTHLVKTAAKGGHLQARTLTGNRIIQQSYLRRPRFQNCKK